MSADAPAPWNALPVPRAGLSVGLFGGSFNPAHEGHRRASLFALRRLGLDRVWWLVTPGNPLKTNRMPSLKARIAEARRVADHPTIAVTGLEAALGTRYTVDTIRRLKALAPQTRFVWLMGADNLAQFDSWRDWRAIAAAVPMAVVDRPPWSLRATAGVAAEALAPYRLPEEEARLLARAAPPAWVFLHGLKLPISSTAIRAAAAGTSPA